MQTIFERPESVLRHRFDIDDYYRMADAGILSGEDRVELIEGKIVARLVADGEVLASVKIPLHLDRRNEPQPDLILLRPRADFYQSSHPTAADVLLLVEVADSSLAYDRGPMLTLYARHGVPEVWIVDFGGRVVEVCSQPGPEGYAERSRMTEGIRQVEAGARACLRRRRAVGVVCG